MTIQLVSRSGGFHLFINLLVYMRAFAVINHLSIPHFKHCSQRFTSRVSHSLISCILLAFLSFSVYAGPDVSLQLKWFHQFQFAGYYAAQKEGYYQEEGLNVTIYEFAQGRDNVDAVINGVVEFSVADSSLVQTKLAGEDVVVLAAIFQQSPLSLMTLDKDELVSPLDLIGKRVMFRRDVDDAVIAAMFSELGIEPGDYTHVPHTFNDDELINGTVDAMSVYITDQPYYYKQQGYRVNLIQPSNYGIDFYGDLLFTSKKFLEENTEQALAFRRASIKGWQYALENEEELIDWMLENLPMNKTKAQLLYEAEQTKRMIKPNLIELGTLNKNRFQRIAEIYQHRNKTTSNGNLDQFLFTEIISPDVDYKRMAYISWIVLALLSFLVLSFWGINKRLMVLVSQRTRELEESKKALKKLVVTDELTGLGNRRKLNQFFTQEKEKAARYERPLSIILFDIDHFKEVNDNFGHRFGDDVLKEVSRLAKSQTRAADLVGRWGGEEFLIVCPETDLIGASTMAEFLRDTMQRHKFPQELTVTASFGVAQWHKDEDAESLFGRCDAALYQAKDSGRNCVKTNN